MKLKNLRICDDELNLMQANAMLFIKRWANQKKTPIPQKEVVRFFKEMKIGQPTALYTLNVLLEKGFIRRGYSEKANRTVYVMIRNI